MKQRITPLPVALGIGVLLFLGCKATKVNQKQTTKQNKVEVSMCGQTIKYYSELIKMTNGQPDVNANTEIIINPSAKLITLTSEPPNQDKVSFDTVIEHLDCNLNTGITEGLAVYYGYIKQKDGGTTKAIIKVEAKDGSLTISNGDPEKNAEFLMVVSKWEIVKE